MADVISVEKRSWVMRQVRGKRNRSTECEFIKVLKQRGISGWRRNYSLPGSPDFVFPKKKVAVFVDGCFWHGYRKHCRMPTSNAAYWQNKIDANVARDRKINRVLKRQGWKVVRFWEHDITNAAKLNAIAKQYKRLIHNGSQQKKKQK